MIRTFGSKDTERVWHEQYVKRVDRTVQRMPLRKLELIHPGEILMEDCIDGFGITQNQLAVSIDVPPRRINEIVHGKRDITADTAIRLARYFGTSEELWMNLRPNYELRLERRALRDQVDAIVPLNVA